jgi:aspartate aminotransferase
MIIADNVARSLERASWIRKMFEEGNRLKAIHGADKVFDFSLGNPNLPPPPAFRETLKRLAAEETPGIHGYMSNAGFPEARAAVARRVAGEQAAAVTADQIILTVGAGGALNTVFRAILDPGDEVLAPRPYFVEYVFYAQNHQGVLRTVPTSEDFDLRVDEVEKALTPRTRAVLLNSPNNPTGRVYGEARLKELADLLDRKSREYGREIFLVADEPYRALAYDGVTVPPIFPLFPVSVVCSSFSKDLSLAGERIGYAAVNPRMEGADRLAGALTFTNRILGFVNAPAFMQRALVSLMDARVDVDYYRKNRDILYDGLVAAGYECRKPEGAFYLFPKSPIADDVAFSKELLQENILAVPGSGFEGPGHIRLAYCCARETAERSLDGFARAINRIRGRVRG